MGVGSGNGKAVSMGNQPAVLSAGNVAVMARRLASPALLFGCVGTDERSKCR
jgi:sugar/nucleoside kinase (ribokinase family)